MDLMSYPEMIVSIFQYTRNGHIGCYSSVFDTKRTISLYIRYFNPMQAAHPDQSFIRVNFGEKHAAHHAPVDLELILDFFSAQQQQIRNELSAQYKTDIPATSFALQFEVENGSVQQTAQRLAKVAAEQKSKQPQAKHDTSFHYSSNKVLVILQAPEYAELIQSKEQYFTELKTQAAQENHAIHLRVQSFNDLKTIREESKEFGRLAWLQNTRLEFGFVKTELITKFLTIFFEQVIGVDSFNSMLKSFRKLNFELNFAGGDYLKEFPKAKTGGVLATQVHQRTEIVNIIEEAGVEKARLYGFNPTIFLKGDFLAAGLKQHLEATCK